MINISYVYCTEHANICEQPQKVSFTKTAGRVSECPSDCGSASVCVCVNLCALVGAVNGVVLRCDLCLVLCVCGVLNCDVLSCLVVLCVVMCCVLCVLCCPVLCVCVCCASLRCVASRHDGWDSLGPFGLLRVAMSWVAWHCVVFKCVPLQLWLRRACCAKCRQN